MFNKKSMEFSYMAGLLLALIFLFVLIVFVGSMASEGSSIVSFLRTIF